jgi:hypothetical protein
MNLEGIEQDFRNKVCEKLRISTEGVDRFRVFTPFMFEDGDHLAIVLRRENGGWILSDEGHTYMHLTYDLDEKDLQRGTRQKIITNALSVFNVQDREGELIVPIENDSYGDAFFRFVQAILRIVEGIYFSEKKFNRRF